MTSMCWELKITTADDLLLASEGMATIPQGNQELLVVKRQSWKTPGELGVIKSMDCVIFFPSVLDTVGWATGRACSL